MKKILTNPRYYALVAMFAVAVIGIFCVPCDELPPLLWVLTLVVSKVIGLGALYATIWLMAYWAERGELPELLEEIDD